MSRPRVSIVHASMLACALWLAGCQDAGAGPAGTGGATGAGTGGAVASGSGGATGAGTGGAIASGSGGATGAGGAVASTGCGAPTFPAGDQTYSIDVGGVARTYI